MPRSRAATIVAANETLLVQGDLDAVDTVFAPGYVAHLTGRTKLRGRTAVRRFVALYLRAFANLRVEVEVLVEGPGRVAWQRTLRGTHVDTYQGFPATGRRLVWRDVVTSRLEGGRIAEEWVISDLAEQLLRARTKAGGTRLV